MATSTLDFDLGRTRDLAGRRAHVWNRRIVLLLMAAFLAAGLAGVFGQVRTTRSAASPAATVTAKLPQAVRGGLYWPAEITIRARQRIAAPVIVLGSGFVRGMQLNTIEPSPTSEASRHGGLAFSFPTLQAGDSLTLNLQLQVNPTTVGEQDVGVRVEGANVAPIRLPASLTVYP